MTKSNPRPSRPTLSCVSRFARSSRAAALTLGAAGLCAGTAIAQTPSFTASYNGTMSVTDGSGRTMVGQMYRTPRAMRMDMNVDGATSKTIINFDTNQAATIVDTGMGEMAMKMDLDTVGVAAMDPDPATLRRTGASKTVSGLRCDVYRDGIQNAEMCATADGIMLEAVGPDSRMTMSNVTRGPQAPSLFTVPAGGMDFGSMMGSLGGMQGLEGLGGLGGLGGMGGQPATTTRESVPGSIPQGYGTTQGHSTQGHSTGQGYGVEQPTNYTSDGRPLYGAGTTEDPYRLEPRTGQSQPQAPGAAERIAQEVAEEAAREAEREAKRKAKKGVRKLMKGLF